MYTDPNRVHADIPGTVEGNPVFIYHDAFNANKAEVEDLKTRYRAGKVGDGEVKEKLYHAIESALNPMRERRAEYESQPGLIENIILEGTEKTRAIVKQTVFDIRKQMGFTAVTNQLRRRVERELKKKSNDAA